MQTTTLTATTAVGPAFIIAASAVGWVSLGLIVMQAISAWSIG
jgi:hypothetical protein